MQVPTWMAMAPRQAMHLVTSILTNVCGINIPVSAGANIESFWSDPKSSQWLSRKLQAHIFSTTAAYLLLVIIIGRISSKKANNDGAKTANSASEATKGQSAIGGNANSTSLGQKRSISPLLAAFTCAWNLTLGICYGTGLMMLLSSSPWIFTEFAYPSAAYPPLTRFVITIFCLSKPVEFFDTILLYLRGKQLSFFQVYHKLTVALYCWHALYVDVPFAHGFVAANLFMHSIIYIYFAAAEYPAIRRMVAFLRPHITLLQLLQMLIGICTSAQALYHPTVQHQPMAIINAKLCLAMYISYAFLFLKFYLESFQPQLRGGMTAFLLFFHIFALVGVVKLWVHECTWLLFTEALLLYAAGGFGITCGAHRLWAHRSYKAGFLFRAFLFCLTSLANQGSVFHWARDHRVHHKYSERDPDPYNAKRGFFYSHVGWLLLKKDHCVREAGRLLDHDDLLEDGFVRIQHRLDPYWNQFFCFILPAVYAYFRYGDFWTGFFVLGCFRWCICLHATWMVNSVCHKWGDRPYDISAEPCESVFTAVFAVGEGWHSFHHKYPHDYAASEGDWFVQYNPSQLLIDVGARFGLVWDRKRALGAWNMKKNQQDQSRIQRRIEADSCIKMNPVLSQSQQIRQTVNNSHAGVSAVRSLLRLSIDLIVIAALMRCVKWSLDQYYQFNEGTVAGIAQLSVSIAILGCVLGTFFFSLWMHIFAMANGTFMRNTIIPNILGPILSTFLMVPYQQKRFQVPGETPSIRPFLKASMIAILKTPSWCCWFTVSFGSIIWSSFLMYQALHGQALTVFAYFFLPYLVHNAFIVYYFFNLERRGPHDVKNNNFRYDFYFISPSAIPWMYATMEKRDQAGNSFSLMELLNIIHQNIMYIHVLQAATFEVPLHRAKTAYFELKKKIESIPSQVKALPLGSFGFEIENPQSLSEEYDSRNSCLGMAKKSDGIVDYSSLLAQQAK